VAAVGTAAAAHITKGARFVSLPFSQDQFFAVFAAYNLSVYPAQLLFLLLGLGVVLACMRPVRGADRAIGGVLALLWLWMGVVYQWGFFSAVNPAARAFGAGFVVEAGLLVWYQVIRRHLSFRMPPSWRGGLGLALLIYAFAVYPAVGWALGHRYPAAPTFGLPCPTTIMTLGLLLWTERRPPAAVMVIPWLWGLVGTTAAFQLGIREDLGLLVAVIVSAWGWVAGYPRRQPLAA
jgi:hypothetical protein